MKEIWRMIDFIPELRKDQYMVSSDGRIKSLYFVKRPRNQNKEKYYYRELIMSPHKNKGYMVIGLSNINYRHTYRIHRLVAEAFIPNIDNKPEVNHKDGNKENNSYLNLEWVTRQENQKHKCDVLGLNKHTSRPVKCLTTNKIYPSALEAERQTGIDHSWIARSCNKGCLTKGLSWKYYKD